MHSKVTTLFFFVYSLAIQPYIASFVNAQISINVGCTEVRTETWGGLGGPQVYNVIMRPNTLSYIQEIKGNFGAVIDRLTFKMVYVDGHNDTFHFGGSGGTGNEFAIQFDPDEKITGIKGKTADLLGQLVTETWLATLYIRTNKRGWLGPIGIDDCPDPCYRNNTTPYSLSLRDGYFTGIYGSYNYQKYVYSIGGVIITNRC